MKERDLKKFFKPRSIAIIGASEDRGKVGGTLFDKVRKSKSLVIPINKKHEKINGIKCYSSVESYPKKIDLAVIATPAPTVSAILESCIKKNIKNVIIISSGFAEEKNNKLQKDLAKVIAKNKINVLGPNCFGISNPELNLDLTFSNMSPKKGSIAFIAQSGALWSYAADLNVKFSGYVSLGNMADLSFNDWLKYFIDDKKTKKIILYIEKLKMGREFIEICKKSKKEIVVIKAGRTEAGKKATISHTASIATDYKIYNGAFNQAGVTQEKSLAKAFGMTPQKIPLKRKKSFIITNAGGAGALLVDRLVSQGHEVKAPLDILGTARAKDYDKELKKLERENYAGNIIIILTPQTMSEPEKTAEVISNSKLKKNIVALFLGDKSIRGAKKILEKSKVPVITRI